MGHEQIDFYAVDNMCGGEFYLAPGDRCVGRIKVGLDTKNWNQCVTWLLHESFEYLTCRFRVRYERSGKLSGDHGAYTFIFSHEDFSEICTHQSEFVSASLPRLADVFKKHSRK